jgi:hypothetical protein
MRALALACLFSATGFAGAQDYTIDWFTIDGGGGTSSGGAYTISGTIGQPDAGAMSGGQYSLIGGYWSIIDVIQTPEAPLLMVTRDLLSGSVTVSWDGPADGWVLDQTGALASPPAAISWSQVPFPYQTNGTRISITVLSPVGHRFYRLRK